MNSKVRHLGLIPDGGRRWAQENQRTILESYSISMRKLGMIINAAFEAGVQIQSVYCLGKYNMARQGYELEAIYESSIELLAETLPELCDRWRCRVEIVGLTDSVPPEYRKYFVDLARRTEVFRAAGAKRLYLLMVYDPWDEIRSAVKRAGRAADFEDFLWVKEQVDLVIRTGKGSALLMSNFLPLQSGYAEYFLIEKYFNDVEVSDVVQVLEAFPLSRSRLMGK